MRGTPPRSRTAPILMYHALSPSHAASFTRWTLRPDLLDAHLEHLASSGYRTVTVSDLAGLLRRGDLPDRTVALTFDDAYADFHQVALPLLVRYRMTATVYAPTGCIGSTSEWMREEGEGERALMTWSQLLEAASTGVEVGAHSHTHPHLTRIPTRRLCDELRRSADTLGDRLGHRPTGFAYPYGEYDPAVRAAVVDAGFSTACTMIPYAARRGDDPWQLPRLTVSDTTDVPGLDAALRHSRGRLRRLALRAERRSGMPLPSWHPPMVGAR